MRDVNKVILIGRLGANPVQRFTKKGISVVNFPLATTRLVKTEAEASPSLNAELRNEETIWHQIVVWGKLGESCLQYLGKGKPVFIEGGIRTRKYEDKAGVTRYTTEIHVDQISFLGSRVSPSHELQEQVSQEHASEHEQLSEGELPNDVPSSVPLQEQELSA